LWSDYYCQKYENYGTILEVTFFMKTIVKVIELSKKELYNYKEE